MIFSIFLRRTFLVLTLLSHMNCFSLLAEPQKVIRSIIVEGNNIITDSAIKNAISHRPGDHFRESDSTASIHSLTTFGSRFGAFEQVKILKKDVEENKVDVKILLTEKKNVIRIDFEGNSIITTKKLGEALQVKDIQTISDYDLLILQREIKKEYKNQNYLNVKVTASIKNEAESKCSLSFLVEEGQKTVLKHVDFIGCKEIPSHQIRRIVATKEDWLFGFTEKAGKFSKESVDLDKKIIEQHYKDSGFLNTHVTEKINIDDNDHTVKVTFEIDEGPRSKVRYITLPTDDEFEQSQIKKMISLNKDDYCSGIKLNRSIDNIRMLFGNKGYIFADAYYDIRPVGNTYDQVDVWFYMEKGKNYTVNDIVISGNKKTKDRVLLRELAIEPNDIANRAKMEVSKNNLERTGYFAKDEVDWKTTPIADGKVDLEFNVREVRTGNASLSLCYAPDHGSSDSSIRLVGDVRKRNVFGQGWDLGTGVQFGKNNLKHADIEFACPYMFDQDISFAANGYLDKVEYGELGAAIRKQPMERTIGACGKVGFALFPKSTQIKTIMEAGAEDILFSDFSFREQELNSFKDYIKEEKFRSGLMGWIGYSLIKDARNHELYPTEGYKAEFNQRLVFPLTSTEFSMAKTELTGHYFFPLLPKGKLTFGMHGKLGIIGQLSNDKPIPYKELYHVGGPGSLRGFRWGEAGPFFAPSELPVGAKNMALLSLELTTPLGGSAYDMSTPRGYVFYDIGGGWNTPKPKNSIMTSILEEHGAKKISDIFHDNFHLRHTIGFGLKLSAPTPITVEWGYKLDRKALSSERPSEMHISMNLPF